MEHQKKLFWFPRLFGVTIATIKGYFVIIGRNKAYAWFRLTTTNFEPKQSD